jgi:NAD+ synthase (glutamine-hydrolysing)
MRQALVLGVRDFIAKTGFKKVHLGLSGGIDSAVVACLAADALGPMNVTGISLPSQFTSKESRQLAEKLAHNLGIGFMEMPFDPAYQDMVKIMDKGMGPAEFGLPHENLQARLRGVLLMAYSNREGSILLATSNKSEMAVGYATLYGDLCGALEPIGDLLKTEVYELARHYNSQGELIPNGILERAPSAELRPNQKDQDSLPPYETLDPIIRRLVEEFHPPKGELEKKIHGMMLKSEFKRWQAPPILKVSDHAFGRGRRFPVAHTAKD